jgi:hypothetical protein
MSISLKEEDVPTLTYITDIWFLLRPTNAPLDESRPIPRLTAYNDAKKVEKALSDIEKGSGDHLFGSVKVKKHAA